LTLEQSTTLSLRFLTFHGSSVTLVGEPEDHLLAHLFRGGEAEFGEVKVCVAEGLFGRGGRVLVHGVEVDVGEVA
jgi:hypothetical protein